VTACREGNLLHQQQSSQASRRAFVPPWDVIIFPQEHIS
jgi:hypothetical protein